MPLSPELQAKREGKITASFTPYLMAGDDTEIFNKWLELIGDPSWTPPDLTYDWAPNWGSHGEPFMLNWHERKTKQPIVRRQEFVQHPTLDYVGCTLDGFREFDSTVLDAKVCMAFRPIDEILAHYTPQLIVQRACVQCMHAALLLVHGSAEVHEYPIYIEPDYEAKVWKRIAQFWDCVQNLIEPVELQFPRIVPPEQWRTIDLNLDTDGEEFNWAPNMRERLKRWDGLKDDADSFEFCIKDIKQLLPDDVGTLTYAGLIVKRNRANAISIKRVNR